MTTYAEMKAKQTSFFNAFKDIILPVKQKKPKDVSIRSNTSK